MKLININIGLKSQLEKVNEEVEEFIHAIKHEDIDAVISEFYDVVQVMLTTLDTLDLIDFLEDGKEKHNQKLLDRKWILREIGSKGK